MKKLLMFFSFLLLFAFIVPFSFASEIKLVTTNTSVKQGDIFTVSVQLSGGENTLGTDMILDYDQSLLKVTGVQPGGLYSSYQPSKDERVDENVGKIYLSGSASIDAPVVSSGEFATVTFKTKKTGNATIAFDYEAGDTTKTGIVGFGGNELVTNNPEVLTISISRGNIFASLWLRVSEFWSSILSVFKR